MVGEGLVHKRIGKNHKLLFVNKAIYICDYQNDGVTKRGVSLRIKNPLGGMANSKEFLSKDVKFDIRLKKMILYITYSFFAKFELKKSIIDGGYPILAIICTPFSYLLYRYWKNKY